MAPVTKTRVSLSFLQKKAILEEVEKNLRSIWNPEKFFVDYPEGQGEHFESRPPSARMRAREAKYPRKRLLPCVFCRDTLKTAMRTQ